MSAEIHFVYIIATLRDGVPSAPVKVGITKSMGARFSTLKTASAYPLEIYAALPFPERYDAQKLEWAFHKVMSRRRLRGEWFDMEPHQALRAMGENIRHYLSRHIGLEKNVVNDLLGEMGFAA